MWQRKAGLPFCAILCFACPSSLYLHGFLAVPLLKHGNEARVFFFAAASPFVGIKERDRCKTFAHADGVIPSREGRILAGCEDTGGTRLSRPVFAEASEFKTEREEMMNMKAMMMLMTALVCGISHAITSEEIATALGVDPSIGTFSCSGDDNWSVVEATSNETASVYGFARADSSSDWRYSTLSYSLTVKEVVRLTFDYKTQLSWDWDGRCKFTFSSGLYTRRTSASESVRSQGVVLIPGTHTLLWNLAACRGEQTQIWIENIKIEQILQKSPVVSVSDIKCTQRTPWNGKVDIDYTVTCDKDDADIWVYPVGFDKDTNTTMAPRALEGDGVNAPVKAGTHRMTWTVTDDYPNFNSTAFTVKMTAIVGAAPYMVVDLSGGVDAISYPVSYLSSVPAGGWGDEYKTTKLVLRLVPSGSFWMGSPSDEWTRNDDETLHGVVLTKPFYIGVFECTQKQYELVMGGNPSSRKGMKRPVEQVSYNHIRGAVNGAGWPTHNQVDADSFMGRLRSKANMLFDLPTEAQWEYACRAGTSTSLNSGKNYDWGENCNEVARWARNSKNSGSDYKYDGKGGYTQTAIVGCYRENAWGLYDMHGNVDELCRDFYNRGLSAKGVVDPFGANSSRDYSSDSYRVCRGGNFDAHSELRSAYRGKVRPSTTYSTVGFRVYCSPVAQ